MSGTHHRRLKALEAFESVSRHLSIGGAAGELGVTPSAVSHQLRKLTEELGERLVVRHGRGIELTPAGERLAKRLREAFTKIDRSVAEVIGTGRDVIRLAVCSCFAPGWLVGRLDSFMKDNPGIDLQLRMYALYPELTDHVADAFITIEPTETGFWSRKIVTERLVAVAPAGVAQSGLTNGRTDHSAFAGGLTPITTWLEPEDFADDWRIYSERAGVPLKDIDRGTWLQASHYHLALAMAKAGLGVALVPDFLAEPAIAAGAVERIGQDYVPTGEDYYLCVKTARRDEVALKALIRWFRSQAAEDPVIRTTDGKLRKPRAKAESSSFAA